MILFNELKAEMARKGITQKDISKAINKTEATISLIFNKKAILNNDESTIISDLLELDCEKRGYIFLNPNLTKL